MSETCNAFSFLIHCCEWLPCVLAEACAALSIAVPKALLGSGYQESGIAPSSEGEQAGFPMHLRDLYPGMLAKFYVSKLPLQTLKLIKPARSELNFGSLCSGTDFIKHLLKEICDELQARCGWSVMLKQLYSCENNPDMQTWIRTDALNSNDSLPQLHSDLFSIVPGALPTVDLLVAGFSCKSLSSASSSKRTLEDVDYDDHRCSSGNTAHALMKVISATKPQVVLLENVVGLLSNIPNATDMRRRNVDVLLDQFRNLGYVVEYSKLCSTQYLVPQRRSRVWLMAFLQTMGGCVFQSGMLAMRSASFLPFEMDETNVACEA